MAAPKGNSYWRNRYHHGADPSFTDPQDLWLKCCGYFEWVEANPLKEVKAFAHQGNITKADLPLRRVMTLSGLRIHLGIHERTWQRYRELEGFCGVCERVEEIIRNQKFEGAAAGQFNAMIIARDLGLREQTSNELTGADGGPLQVQGISIEFVKPNSEQG